MAKQLTSAMAKTFIPLIQAVMLMLLCTQSWAVSLNEQAPDFHAKSTQGPNLRLAEYRGKVVLLNFWATWCGPCRQELPELNQLHDKLSGQGLVIMGMNIDNKTQDVFSFLKDVPVNFPVLLDPKQKVSQNYSVSGMPNTFILDRDGKVRHIHKGYQPGVIDQYEKEIRTLLNEL